MSKTYTEEQLRVLANERVEAYIAEKQAKADRDSVDERLLSAAWAIEKVDVVIDGDPKWMLKRVTSPKSTTTHEYPLVTLIARALEHGISEEQLREVLGNPTVVLAKSVKDKETESVTTNAKAEKALYALKPNGWGSVLNGIRDTKTEDSDGGTVIAFAPRKE